MSLGFRHDNRGIGIRNHQLILPSVVCSTHVAHRIAKQVGAISFAHQHGCGIIGDDVAGVDDFFAALARHPNVSSVLIIGLGCETIQAQELGARLSAENQSTRYKIIQETGGVEATVQAGVDAARTLTIEYPPVTTETNLIKVGLDLGVQSDYLDPLKNALTSRGYAVFESPPANSSTESFAFLMLNKVHIIISQPSVSQPPSGFPLIPVLNIPRQSALHQATYQDFDFGPNESIDAIIERLENTISGQLTRAEINKIGEIKAPRLVRSV